MTTDSNGETSRKRRARFMLFHNFFGIHTADASLSHWSGGHHESHCTVCGRKMTKLPGLPWVV